MSAILKPAGDQTAGVQPKGITQQYQLSATAANKTTSTDIHPADTSMQVTLGGPVLNIIGTVPPGKPGIRQVSGVIQRAAAAILCDSTSGVIGNSLISTTGTGLVPAVNPAQLDTAALSNAPQTE
jgi:hypothetical protein